MKYIVYSRITARWKVAVDAESLDEAMKMSNAKINEADFGEAFDVEAELHHVEDADGNYLKEER